MCVFNPEHGRRFLPLIIVAVRLEIVQDRVRVAFCFDPRWINNAFTCFARPSLDNAVAGLSQPCCAFPCGFEPVFACLVVAVNDFFTILRGTFSTTVPVAAVVLKYSLCFRVVAVYRRLFNPTLATNFLRQIPKNG